MTVLAIDSTGQDCRVALFDGANVRAFQTSAGARQQSETLIPMVQQVLADAGLLQPDKIAVAAGPGSFTGIRIGIAAAQGLARGWECPCVAVDRFHMLGHSVTAKTAPYPVAIVLDSLRTELFAQLWFQGAPIGPVFMAPPDELAHQMSDQAKSTTGTGDFSVLGDIPQPFGDISAQLSLTHAYDDLRVLACAAYIPAFAAQQAAPFYIRPPDVTIRAPQT